MKQRQNIAVRSGVLLLVSIFILGACSKPLKSQTSQSFAIDSLSPFPFNYSPFIVGAIYASFPLSWMDNPIRTARNNFLGKSWRNHYDDYIQYVPYAFQLWLRSTGFKGRSHGWGEMLTADALGTVGMASMVLLTKYAVRRMRPDGSSANSFPSGHTATAFLGAELFNIEYGEEFPVLAKSQYLIALAVGLGRIANNRHWYSDVLWGGFVGVLMARLGYLASDLIFGRYYRITDNNSPSESYFFTALFHNYHLFAEQTRGSVGVQLGWHTPSLSYALETALNVPLREDSIPASGYCNFLIGVPLYQCGFAHLYQSFGIGIAYDRNALENLYPHMQIGWELSPQVHYLKNLSLCLRLHGEPYKQPYITIGLCLRCR